MHCRYQELCNIDRGKQVLAEASVDNSYTLILIKFYCSLSTG